MTNNIPRKVEHAFESLIAMYGDCVVFLGNRAGVDYYMFPFPEDIDTGFPNVVAYESGNVSNITGFDAVNIVASFNPED